MYKESLINQIATIEFGIDQPQEFYDEFSAKMSDLSIPVLEESLFNRQTVTKAVDDPTGEFAFITKQIPLSETMTPSETYNLSKQDIAAIGAMMGDDTPSANLYRLEQKQNEILEQSRLINEYTIGMEELGFGDNPAFQTMLAEQNKLLDDLHKEYKELYEKVTGEKHDE